MFKELISDLMFRPNLLLVMGGVLRLSLNPILVFTLIFNNQFLSNVNGLSLSPPRKNNTFGVGLGGGGLGGIGLGGGGGLGSIVFGEGGGVGGRASCESGNFYRHPDFFSEVTNEFINENPNSFITASQHCAAALLGYTQFREICACDCFKSHGAADSEVCVLDLENLRQAPLGCVCLYSEAERRTLPCLAKDSNGGGGRPKNFSTRSQQHPDRQRLFGKSRFDECKKAESSTKRTSCMESVCEPVFETVSVLTCTEETLTIPNHNGTIKGSDICSIDCFYVHGSRTEPYGICTPHEGKSICVCLY